MSVVAITLIVLCILGSITAIIDPYFHYHKPLESLEYPIYDERHQSDGILRNFDYDTIIIGSSMTLNFKTSELDSFFGTNAVKVPLSAATYNEVNSNLQRAFAANPNIKKVFIGLDGFAITRDKNAFAFAAEQYPTYLTDNYLLNDVNYLFNKQAFVTGSLRVLMHTLQKNKTTSFDEYGNYMDLYPFGKEAVLLHTGGRQPANEEQLLSEETKQIVTESIQKNVISLVEQHPDVQFYYFFPPVSMYYFYMLKQNGTLKGELETYKIASNLMLQCDNIHLFSFFEELDMISNPDNYMDAYHYCEDINSQMLVWMSEGSHLLTKENYVDYWDSIYETFNSYNYDPLF